MSQRGTKNSFVVARFAGEGVPITAIARGLHMNVREVERDVMSAVRAGLIAASPPLDWPDGSRIAERAPTIAAVDIDSVEQNLMPACAAFGLTANQARVFLVILALGYAPKTTIHAAVLKQRQVNDKLVDVYVCNLRKRLRLHDIAIKTHWGIGYEIEAADRARAVRLLAGARPAEEVHAHAA